MTVTPGKALPKNEQIKLYKIRAVGLAPDATRRQFIAGKRAEEALVRSCVGLVTREAGKWSGHNIAVDDLVSEGLLGVVRALVTFEPERNPPTAFSSHAQFWVYAFISKYVAVNSEKLKYKAAGIYGAVRWDGYVAIETHNNYPRDESDAYEDDEVARLADPAPCVEDQVLDALGLGSVALSPVLALLSDDVARYFTVWQSVPTGLNQASLSKRLGLGMSQVRKLEELTRCQIAHPALRGKLDRFM